MNDKQRAAIDALARGETVENYREGGNSMTPIIKSMEPVTLIPVDPSKLERGDAVFVKVHGRIYNHKVLAIQGGRVQIGNNKGGVNGWTPFDHVYGLVSEIGGRPVGGALAKRRPVSSGA